MRLFRMSLLTLDQEPSDLSDIQLGDEMRIVGPLVPTVRKNVFLLSAGYKLKHLPKITREKLVVVPNRQRVELEEMIEQYANLVSVALCCNRQISSPMPDIGFYADTSEDEQFLENAVGILMGMANRGHPTTPKRFPLEKHLDDLSDRLDGVALLAEALGQSHASGQFHEIIRFFERAFGVGGHALISPMAQFLSCPPFNYNVEEVRKWFELRDGLTHADKRNEIFYEADALSTVGRMLQAAYDILLNKIEWRTISVKRRQSWKPVTGTLTAEGGLFLTKGEDFIGQFRLFDTWGRFPLNTEGALPRANLAIWTGPRV